MDNEETSGTINVELLESIKNFMDDLASVTDHKNFKDYHTIVSHIDETKIKSYFKLIKGFKNFFIKNNDMLLEGNFDGLIEPYISYITDNGSFSFDFQKTFQEAQECNQDIIKDHLNHIWNLLNKSKEELYINKIFEDLKSRFSPDLTREEQMMIAKELFTDFQKQNLDISAVIKIACKKARDLLVKNDSEDSKTMVLIDAVEEIDVNNFDIIQFMGLIGKLGTLFADGENNPLTELLSNVFFTENTLRSIE